MFIVMRVMAVASSLNFKVMSYNTLCTLHNIHIEQAGLKDR